MNNEQFKSHAKDYISLFTAISESNVTHFSLSLSTSHIRLLLKMLEFANSRIKEADSEFSTLIDISFEVGNENE